MMKDTVVYNIDQLREVAKQIALLLKGMQVVTLEGSMGAGKTTLVAALLREWGVLEPVTSPTFTYVNMYETDQGKIIYHFDLYRLSSLLEFEQAGFAEYLYQDNSIVFIEWPEFVMPLLTHSACHIKIDFKGLEQRRLHCSINSEQKDMK